MLPHSAAVTTNSDLAYDAACEAAGIEVRATHGMLIASLIRCAPLIAADCLPHQVRTLPYESRAPIRGALGTARWLLKLHGDVNHPEDIILT